MKRYTAIVLLIALTVFTKKINAQLVGELYFQSSYNMWLANSKDLNSFYRTYNTAVGGITKGFNETVGTMNGYGFALGTRFLTDKGYFDLDLSTNRYASFANKASFTGGDSREVKINNSDWGFNFGFGWGRKFCIGPSLGMGAQRTTVNAGYRYANGTLSYGTEYTFNGIYNSLRLNVTYGLSADVRIVKYLRIGVSAIRLARFLPADKFYYSDNQEFKGTGGNYYVPKDYGLYANGGSFDGNEAQNDLRGWRISLNVRIQLPYGSSYE